ncbi:MAG: prolyl oligopeptidase family serine peptidase [Planctomycetaceae bacterium]|nr:prolyl oligopeptidase family serine peptidase [Planctomycetaceae bacterium]
MIARRLLIFVAIPMFVCLSAGADESRQTKQALNVQVPVHLDYLLALPKDYESQEKWPLLLFLHGAGERGHDLNQVLKHGPPKLVSEGRDLPFIVVSPQCPPNVWWEPIELTALLDDVIAKHKVDTDRIYVTGLSMGGFGTWRLAAHTPERFAAIAPICGGGEPYWARRYGKLPTWVFHGAKDQAVPLARSEQMVEAMKKAGNEPKFTVYPEAEHDSWTETYNNPEFYDWLLSHRRINAAAGEQK